MRLYYAHPVDVLRKFNPQMNKATLDSRDFIGESDLEKVTARIEGVEAEFESSTGRPLRLARVGEESRVETYETLSADLRRNQHGVKSWLYNRNVAPLDPEKGDRLLVRRGRDNWRDITGDTDRYELNSKKGYVRIYTRYGTSHVRPSLHDEYAKITYRYGALGGGRRNDAGETTLSAAAPEGETTLSVDNETMLPRRGVVKVDDEYVNVVSRGDGTIDVARGTRGTTEKAHDAGDVVHYCPVDVREAVAAKAAIELQSYADWLNELVDGDGMRIKDKLEEWNKDWDKVLQQYAEVRSF